MMSGWMRRTQALLLVLLLLIGLAPWSPTYSAPAPANQQATKQRQRSHKSKSIKRPRARTHSKAKKPVAVPDKELNAKEDSIKPVLLPGWQSLREVGRGTAIVFSPDIARPANQAFYEKLGFLYIETADWQSVIDQILEENRDETIIHTVILETHGNHGHGLKLQTGKSQDSDRSYISLGALRELLDGSGVEQCIITACNAGRLNRPDIYNRLDARNLLTANYGIINASADYNPAESSVRLLRRNESEMEMLSTVAVRELPKSIQAELDLNNDHQTLTISDLTIQYILHDPALKLTDMGYVVALSNKKSSPSTSERLIATLFTALSRITSFGLPVEEY